VVAVLLLSLYEYSLLLYDAPGVAVEGRCVMRIHDEKQPCLLPHQIDFEIIAPALD
jgi:hypothetical protein